MKKMVYLFDSTYRSIPGIRKKSLMQTKAFFHLGYEAYLISVVNSAIEIYDYINDECEFISFRDTIEYYKIIFEFINKIEPDILYVRKKFLLNLFVMDFYKSVREDFPEMKIVLEIPAFPYDDELIGTVNEKHLEIDAHYRKYLCKYFDFSTNFNDFDEVLGIKSLKMYNCVDIGSIRMNKPSNKIDKVINLSTATSMSFWNGFERLIAGMRGYYENDYEEQGCKIYFHIAGEGPELGYYKRLTTEYNLNDYVKFYGVIKGDDLDNFYDLADLGVLALGLYKINSAAATSIRMCEFCAKGIPVIHSGRVPMGAFYHGIEVSNNDSIIDVNKIIDYYDKLQEIHDYSKKLRKFAEKNYDWKIYIKNLITAISE